MGPIEIEEVEEQVKDGYFLVRETHAKSPYKAGKDIDRIRYFILTKKDAKGRNSLHRAAECGDKHFCTMICYEAADLNFTEVVVDVKDNDGLTPLYLLAEHGFRKAYDYDEDEENLMDGLGKTVVEEICVDKDNLKLDKKADLRKPKKDMKQYENLDDFRGELN
jgi:ankyrin repeat protein